LAIAASISNGFAKIVSEHAAPVDVRSADQDRRPPDETLGYDTHGLPD
jgi:hypothetical protein